MDEEADTSEHIPTRDRSVNVTDGPLLVPMLVLAAPVVVAYTLDMVYYLVDLYWIGYLGTDGVAAVSYAWPIVFLFTSIGLGITTAGTVLVAQAKGGGRLGTADHIASQTLTVVTAFAIVIAVAGYVLTPMAVTLIGATPGTDPHTWAISYVRITFLGMVPMFWFFAFDALARGWGDTRTPLYLVTISVLVNVIIDPFAILGFADNPVFGFLGMATLGETLYAATGFDGYGVAGAAGATVCSRTIGAVIGVWLLFDGSLGLAVEPAMLRPSLDPIRRIGTVGLPTSAEMGLRASGIAVMTAIIALEGDRAIAAYGISEYLAALLLLPAIGLARGIETVVGQNLGAGLTARAWRAVGLGAGVVVVVFAVVVAAAYPVAESIAAVFLAAESDDTAADVISIAAAFVWIVGPTYVCLGVFHVVLGAFRGSGHTRLALVFAAVELWAIRIPLSAVALLWLGTDVVGVWYAFAASYVISTGLVIVWFLRGTWTDPFDAAR